MMFADAVKALGGYTYSWGLYNVVVLTTISTSRNTEGPAYISGVRPNISQAKSKRLCNQRWKLEFVRLAFKAGDSGFV